MSHDIPHENCSPYRAIDQDCTAINTCQSCTSHDHCSAVPASAHWGFRVSDHGSIRGKEMIQREILSSGPIVCVIAVTTEFKAYAGGIFNDSSGVAKPNHAIMVGGWGRDNGIDYWLVRNSWGRYWGEDGWGRIAMGPGEMQLSSVVCDWATPKPFEKPMPYKTLLRPRSHS